MKKQFGITLLITFLFSTQVSAATPQVLGEYGDWTAYVYKDGRGSVCYMVSKPKKDEGKYSKRGDIYAVVTHRPAEKAYDEVSFVAGYSFKPQAAFTVKIGNQIFNKRSIAYKSWN